MSNIHPDALPDRRSFSLKEIAQRNGCSVSYVYQQAKIGALRTHKPGGSGPARVLAEDETTWLRGDSAVEA